MRYKRVYYPRCTVTGKVRYPSNIDANKARVSLIRDGKAYEPLSSYFCCDCKGYHLGQNTGKWSAV